MALDFHHILPHNFVVNGNILSIILFLLDGANKCMVHSRPGVSNTRPARAFCGVRDAFREFWNTVFQIDVAKCLGKRCREINEPKLDDTSAVFILAIQTNFSLSNKFLRNLGSMPKTFTHIFTYSRKHTTEFLVKSFGECCGNRLRCWRSLVSRRQVTAFLFRNLCPRREY